MEPRPSIPNWDVKRWRGEDTAGGALWETILMPTFFNINTSLIFYSFVTENYLGFDLAKAKKIC